MCDGSEYGSIGYVQNMKVCIRRDQACFLKVKLEKDSNLPQKEFETWTLMSGNTFSKTVDFDERKRYALTYSNKVQALVALIKDAFIKRKKVSFFGFMQNLSGSPGGHGSGGDEQSLFILEGVQLGEDPSLQQLHGELDEVAERTTGNLRPEDNSESNLDPDGNRRIDKRHSIDS